MRVLQYIYLAARRCHIKWRSYSFVYTFYFFYLCWMFFVTSAQRTYKAKIIYNKIWLLYLHFCGINVSSAIKIVRLLVVAVFSLYIMNYEAFTFVHNKLSTKLIPFVFDIFLIFFFFHFAKKKLEITKVDLLTVQTIQK